MSRKSDRLPDWAPAYPDLYNAFSDFLLSRQAILCGEKTLQWYAEMLGYTLDWMAQHNVHRPEDIIVRHVRAYISELVGRGVSDSYVHNHARTIRTFLKSLENEKYILEPVKFEMLPISDKRLPFAMEVARQMDVVSWILTALGFPGAKSFLVSEMKKKEVLTKHLFFC